MKDLLIFGILLLLFGQYSFSQTERRAKKDEIPAGISSFIQKTYPSHSKVKYYKEVQNDSLYYEAVFENNEGGFDLLFNDKGYLIETELTLSYKDLPAEIRQKIESYLQKNFIDYKIHKTQEVDFKGVLMYELAMRARKKTGKGFYEIYFDRMGVFLKMDTIKLNAIPSLY